MPMNQEVIPRGAGTFSRDLTTPIFRVRIHFLSSDISSEIRPVNEKNKHKYKKSK